MNGEAEALRIYHVWRIALFKAANIVVLGLSVFVASAWQGSLAADIVRESIIAAGAILVLFGMMGRLWATLYIGGRKARALVTDGPYSVTRNPLYLFSTVAAAGVGAFSGSLVLALVFAIITGVYFQFVIRREEHFLAPEFGAAFETYASRVPRFFPAPALWHSPATVEASPRHLARTFFYALSFFVPYALFGLARLLQEQGVIPVLARLW